MAARAPLGGHGRRPRVGTVATPTPGAAKSDHLDSLHHLGHAVGELAFGQHRAVGAVARAGAALRSSLCARARMIMAGLASRRRSMISPASKAAGSPAARAWRRRDAARQADRPRRRCRGWRRCRRRAPCATSSASSSIADQRHAARAQQRRELAADAAVADEDAVRSRRQRRARRSATVVGTRLALAPRAASAAAAAKTQRVEHDRDQCRRPAPGRALARHQLQRNASPARMKLNSPICETLAAMVEAYAVVVAGARARAAQAASGLPTMMISDAWPAPAAAARTQDRRVEQHADRDEEQHREGVAHRQRIGRRLVAELGLVEQHAGEEGAERDRDAEPVAPSTKATPSAIASTDSVNNSREPVPATRRSTQGMNRRPTTNITRAEQRRACAGSGRATRSSAALAPPPPCRRPRREHRQQHQHQHHHQVLDDQPADRGLAARRCRAGGGPRARAAAPRYWPTDSAQAEHQAFARCSSRATQASSPAQHGAEGDRHDRARERRCCAPRCRSSSEKCRPTPNISRITPISASCGASAGIADEAGRERPDQHAGEQVADQRRQLQPVRQRAEHEGQDQAAGEQGDRLASWGIGSPGVCLDSACRASSEQTGRSWARARLRPC